MNKQLTQRLVLAAVLIALVVAGWFQWRRWQEAQADEADLDRLTAAAKRRPVQLVTNRL